MSNVLRESQLRALVKILLEDNSLGPHMIKINPVVDPSAAITDPANPDFKPQSKPELSVALNALIDDLPNQNIPSIYDSLKSTLESMGKEEDEGEKQMKTSNKKVEESIRLVIRKMLEEQSLNEFFKKDPETGEMVWMGSGPAPKLASGASVKKMDPSARGIAVGPQTPAGKSLKTTFKKMKDEDLGPVDPSAPAPGRTRKNITMQDGEAFAKMAGELGYKDAPGARQAVQKALAKAQFVGAMDPDELEILVLNSMSKYIDFLAKAGGLSPADVQLLKDHPDIVRDLDGFRDFLDKDIRAARKATKG